MKEARNMASVYRKLSYDDLLELKSRKLGRARTCERSVSYLDKQELRRIRFNVKQIEAELACREAQMELGLW